MNSPVGMYRPSNFQGLMLKQPNRSQTVALRFSSTSGISVNDLRAFVYRDVFGVENSGQVSDATGISADLMKQAIRAQFSGASDDMVNLHFDLLVSRGDMELCTQSTQSELVGGSGGDVGCLGFTTARTAGLYYPTYKGVGAVRR